MMYCLSFSYRWICRPIRRNYWKIMIMRRNGTSFVIRWGFVAAASSHGNFMLCFFSRPRKWFTRKIRHRTISQNLEHISTQKHRGVTGWVFFISSSVKRSSKFKLIRGPRRIDRFLDDVWSWHQFVNAFNARL